MANQKIDEEELRKLLRQGKTYPEIARIYGMSVGGVQQAVERIGYTRTNLSHSKFVPWRVTKEHNHTAPITNLRSLSKVAQGLKVPLTKLNTAIRWASRLVDSNLDIDYSRESGFFEKPAQEPEWHIRMCLDEVRKAMQSPSS